MHARAVVPAVFGSAFAQGRTWEWDWSMHPVMVMWGTGGLVMMLMMLVFWGLAIAGLIVGLRWIIRQGRPTRHDEALEILRQRYARGEIDKEEFETRRRNLGDSGATRRSSQAHDAVAPASVIATVFQVLEPIGTTSRRAGPV